jgi:hypothetical protein
MSSAPPTVDLTQVQAVPWLALMSAYTPPSGMLGESAPERTAAEHRLPVPASQRDDGSL